MGLAFCKSKPLRCLGASLFCWKDLLGTMVNLSQVLTKEPTATFCFDCWPKTSHHLEFFPTWGLRMRMILFSHPTSVGLSVYPLSSSCSLNGSFFSLFLLWYFIGFAASNWHYSILSGDLLSQIKSYKLRALFLNLFQETALQTALLCRTCHHFSSCSSSFLISIPASTKSLLPLLRVSLLFFLGPSMAQLQSQCQCLRVCGQR